MVDELNEGNAVPWCLVHARIVEPLLLLLAPATVPLFDVCFAI